MTTSVFSPAPPPPSAAQRAAAAPGVTGFPNVAPGGNERPAATATQTISPGTPYGTAPSVPGATTGLQAAVAKGLGVPPGVGGHVTAPSAGSGAAATPPPSPGATGYGPPPSALAANPAYVAFLNNLGLSDADLQNAAALRAGTVWNGEAGNQAALAQSLPTAQTQTLNREAGVGLENSSQEGNAQALLQQNYNAKIAALQNNAANSVAGIYATLAGQQATGQQNLANVGTNIAGASNIGNALAASPTGAFSVGGQ